MSSLLKKRISKPKLPPYIETGEPELKDGGNAVIIALSLFIVIVIAFSIWLTGCCSKEVKKNSCIEDLNGKFNG